MNKILQHIVTGAFLHDIGKFMQRAEVEISPGTRSIMESGGPTRDGHSTHYHVQWTEQFFEEHLGDIGLSNTVDRDEQAKSLAFKHHNPSTPLQWIITKADHMASGMERGEQKYERNVHKRRRMVPIQTILTLENESSNQFKYCPLTRLTSTNDTCYPIHQDTNDDDLVVHYKKLWENFLDDWQNRRAHGVKANLAFLDALFERYLWCVPASTVDKIPDNSLYGHSQSVAALSACLYKFHNEYNSLDVGNIIDSSQQKFLLVAADLSGIQNFIFSIAHAGGGKVAKRLRARSFMLSRITQVLAYQIIETLGLPFFNVILNAGGKFHLLLPNTNETQDCLNKQEELCQQWLHDKFQGLLSINIAAVNMSGDDFMGKKVGEKFSDLAEALAVKKLKPLQKILINSGGWNENNFIIPDAIIQNENFSGQYDIEPFYDEEKLGRELTKAKCLGIFKGKHGDYPILDCSISVVKEGSEFGKDLDCVVSFKRGKEDSRIDSTVPVYYEYHTSHIPIFDSENPKMLNDLKDENLEHGQILAFDQIAKTSAGRKSVAYLKADVDNLGLLFRNGLEWNDIGWTLSKMATFSRSLEFFFAGRVENILNSDFKTIYTVFCGGDDVFLVGPWDAIHSFSRRLQEEWKRFTGDNQYLTLSAGITMERPLTPVWMAATDAEDALETAKRKQATKSDTPKDQLCSFGHLIKWEESNFVFDQIDKVSEWINQKDISTSMLRNFIYFSELARRYREKEYIEGLRYLPLLSYTISRNVKSDEIKMWVETLKHIDGQAIRHLGFVSNYCQNLNRN